MNEPPHDSTVAVSPAAGSRFLLIACQAGAEEGVFLMQQLMLPQLSRGAWRRGVVTFRLPEGISINEAAELPFARITIESLGQVTGDSITALADAAAATAPSPPDQVHVWQRTWPAPWKVRAGVPESTSPSAAELHARIASQLGCPQVSTGTELVAGSIAARGERVLDIVIDSPDRAWLGWHTAAQPASCWPGGIYHGQLPEEAISRAWLKLDEAIAVFEIPVHAGQRACELGAAPGGASQRLLSLGLSVVGIDPAAIDPRVAEHPRFEHWQMRARDVRLRQLRSFEWLVTDMNIDPSSTMDALERAAMAPGNQLQGIIATLKLPQWQRAADLPQWLDRFRRWGFVPHARQLSCGGRELCVVAQRPS
jgi:23S rRNA (cytidine2498-2'-O)-methyltransferase